MSSVAVLPSTLRDKLDAAARRIRMLRAVRGACLLFLALLCFAAAALAADQWLELAAGVRRALFFAWVGVGVNIALFALIVPLIRRIDPESLAAVVEERYGDLGERLPGADFAPGSGNRDAQRATRFSGSSSGS